MMVEAGSMRVMQVLADATNRIAEGEVLQLLNIHDPTVDETRYLGVVERKTATLFEAATRVGAILAGPTPPRRKPAPATAPPSARRSRSSTTCSTMTAARKTSASASATTCARASQPCRSSTPCAPLPRVSARRWRTRFAMAAATFAEIAQIVHAHGSIEYARACAQAQSAIASQGGTGPAGVGVSRSSARIDGLRDAS
jgi:octaprenyl-diphosphate synthase